MTEPGDFRQSPNLEDVKERSPIQPGPPGGWRSFLCLEDASISSLGFVPSIWRTVADLALKRLTHISISSTQR